MKRSVFALLIAFAGFMVFGIMGREGGEHAEIYKNIMVVFGLLFCTAAIYTAYQTLILLKMAAKNGMKKAVSTTTHGKKNDLRDLVRSKIFHTDVSALKAEVQAFAQEKGMDDAALVQAVKNAVPLVIEDALDDGVLTEEEQASIDNFLEAYGLTADDIPQRGKELLVRGTLIRDLLAGTVKPRMDVSAIPYKAMKGEKPIWGYSDMPVAEVRNVSHFEGGTQGVSVRVAKGLYWRVGKMAAQRVTSKEMKDLGTGTVLITSHHLFYHVGMRWMLQTSGKPQ